MTLPMDRLASGNGGSMLEPAGTNTDDTGASRPLHYEWGVILAGGDGTRLKSLTRTLTGDDRPKQFCALLGGATLVPEWLAVLKVTGLRWSDLGAPQRVRAALQLAGVRPRWVAQG